MTFLGCRVGISPAKLPAAVRVVGFVAQPWMGAGAFAEQISVPPSMLAMLPDALGFPEGSALPVCGLTLAAPADRRRRGQRWRPRARDRRGGDGQRLRASARPCARGARVVAAVRDSDADEARRLGAGTVASTDSGLEEQVRGRWVDGVDACIDTVGLGAAAHGLPRPRWPSEFATSLPTAVPDGARGIDPGPVQVQPDAAATAELADRAAAGELTIRIAETLPVERFRDAYARLRSAAVLHGKIVLTP